jgi:hypothetical protein
MEGEVNFSLVNGKKILRRFAPVCALSSSEILQAKVNIDTDQGEITLP